MSRTPPSGPAAGSRRFWLVVLAFALLNAATWVGYHQYTTSKLRLLRVVRFEQNATLASATPTLRWEFNLDVAHTDQAPGSIAPAVAGKWAWVDGRTLTFTPAAPLPRATRFTVTLPADRLRTPEGIRVDKSFSASFDTEPLKLLAVRQGGLAENRVLLVELEFNDAVIPADVARHVKVTNARGTPVACHAFGEAAGKIVRVQTDALPELATNEAQSTMHVELAAGLAGTSGPLGLAAAVEREILVAADLRATEATAEPPRQGDPQVILRFNNAINLDAVRQAVSIEPAVPVTFSANWDSRVALTGPFEPGKRYVVKIADRPAGADRNAFPRADSFSVFVPDREPTVWFEHAEGYLGSNGNRTLLAHAVNVPQVEVTVTRLYDNNVVAWRNASSGTRWEDATDLSTPVAERTVTATGPKNQRQDLRLSLDDLLPPDAPRDGVYRVSLSTTPGDAPSEHRGRYYYRQTAGEASAIVTLSDVALSARASRDALDVWAVSLSTAKPLADVRVRAYSNKNQLLGEARTNADGLMHLADLHPAGGEHVAVLVAERVTGPRLAGETQQAAHADAHRDLTWLDLSNGAVNLAHLDTAGKPYLRTGFEAFVFTERGVYRPGETAHLRAIVRGADFKLPGSFPVRWQFRRPDLRDWQSQTAMLAADGTTSVDMKLPDDLPTGRWTAELELPGDKQSSGTVFGSTTFNVEEFIPNRMKVKLDVAGNAERVLLGEDDLTAEVQADYLFGRPVTDRPATLTLRVEPATFAPKAWAGWTFGDAAKTADVFVGKREVGGRAEQPATTLDAKGHAKWTIEPDAVLHADNESPKSRVTRRAKAADGEAEYPGPWRATFYAAVIETGGRAVSASRSLDVDRLPYYLGLHAKQTNVAPGQRADFELAAVSPKGEGADAVGDVEVRLYSEIWNTSLVEEPHGYRYVSTRKLEPVGNPQTVALQSGRAACDVTPLTGGSFVLIAKDLKTGFVTSHAFYAAYGAWEDSVSREDPEKLELVLSPASSGVLTDFINAVASPSLARLQSIWLERTNRRSKSDLPSFRPGGTAQLLVRAPFGGRLLLSVETDSVLSTRVIEMPASHLLTPVTLPVNCRPGAFVTATVVRAVDPNAPWRTHRAFGIARIPVDNSDRKLDVQVVAPPEIRPETSMPVAVRVLDATGRPAAGAAITVSAVDEGILTLTNFSTPDPFAFFTAKRAHGVTWADVYGRLMPEVAKPNRSSEVGGDKTDDAPAGRHTTAVTAKRVRPTAFVTGVLHTDAEGVAHADFPVGAFAGQLRVTAVASAVSGVGAAQASTFVRSPLIVQSSWPRFAAPGDAFVVPVVVFNNGSQPGKATVALQILADASPVPLRFDRGDGKQLELTSATIPPGGSATLNVDVTALGVVGVARAKLTATLGEETANDVVELPVRPASPEISIGGYAVATPGHPTTVPVDAGFMPGTARVQVRAGPIPSLELPRGLDYLDRYPYGCAEQTTSGCFPLLALSDIGPKIAPGLFAAQHVEDRLQAGITQLIGMQCADGGLAMWPGGRPSWPWASVYSAHMLVEAQRGGHKVPTDFRDSLLIYVRGLLNEATDKPDVVETQAYACYVLALAGRPERAVMSRLGEIITHPRATGDGESSTAQAQFHLAAAWLASGRRDLAEGLIPQSLPALRAGRKLTGNVSSPVRERAIVLSTLLDVSPDRADLPDLAQRLADAGREGRWQSTQDAGFAVMALGKYLRQLKADAPYERVRVLQAGTIVAAADSGVAINLEAPDLAAASPLTFEVDGPAAAKGHLSWLVSGVPLQPPVGEDAGVRVRRRYLTSAGKPVIDRVHSGDLVQVEITVEAPGPLENFVIDDLLPAGLEIENAHLATAADEGEVADSKVKKPAFSAARSDARDDRLVVVGAVPGGGPVTLTYLARAVTPGTFVVPPIRGECMYDIGVRSLNGGGTLTVENWATKDMARTE